MKIAIPTRDNHVDDHFGHCDHYTIFTVENKEIVNTEELPSPQGCGCKSGIAVELKNLGVELMIAGSMGDGARTKLESQGIKVIRGCSGHIQIVIKSYIAGIIQDSGQGCAGHNGDHQCGEHQCSGH